MHPLPGTESISADSSFQSCQDSSSFQISHPELDTLLDRSVRDVIAEDAAFQSLLDLMIEKSQTNLLAAQQAAKRADARTERRKRMLVVLYSELEEARNMKDAATHLDAMLDAASQSVGDMLIATLHENYPEFEAHLAQAFPAWNAQLCGATNAARLAELAADLLFKKKVLMGLETVVKARYSQIVNTKKQKKVFRKKQKAFRKKRDRGVKIKDCSPGSSSSSRREQVVDDPESGEGVSQGGGSREDVDDGDDEPLPPVPALPARPAGPPAPLRPHGSTGSHGNTGNHGNTTNRGSVGGNAEQAVAAARRSGRIKQTLETAL